MLKSSLTIIFVRGNDFNEGKIDVRSLKHIFCTPLSNTLIIFFSKSKLTKILY